MPKSTLKATTKSNYNSTTVKCESRGFSFTLQKTEEEPGKNHSMNPMEAVLCALGGCQVISAVNYAKQHNIKLNDISIELEGDFDTVGMMGLNDIRPGYEDIRCKIILDTDASSNEIGRLTKYIKERAPVVDTIENPVRLNVESVIVAKH